MQIQDLTVFLDRPIQFVAGGAAPPHPCECEGKFTPGDLVRHIATIERYMRAETVTGRPNRYASLWGRNWQTGHEAVLEFAERLLAAVNRHFCPA